MWKNCSSMPSETFTGLRVSRDSTATIASSLM
jgi:hypothetical protein